MTDPRAVERYSFSEFGDELIKDDFGAWIKYDDHVKALADAERRGMERAARMVEEMYLKPERIWDADTLDGAINTIRAQAQELERMRSGQGISSAEMDLTKQLAASQARCREMERELAQVTGKCKGLQDIVDIHNSLDTVPRSRYDVCNQDWLDEKAKCQRVVENATVEINRLEQQLAQLQATVKDLQAALLAELELKQKKG